ncbi:MAG: 6-carboxytetrahydropterin synthase [Acidobacteriota bacterium]|nr:6-carboxytetrahydropterin synthase [Acidobacteriota bacterium]
MSKHPEKCRFPHGHSLRIEVVARGRELNDQDMVCDYKALKMIVVDVVERLDHAMALNSSDPQLEGLAAIGDRVLLFDDCDPTTEVLARWIFEQIGERLAAGGIVQAPTGTNYEIPADLELERVRVWETSSSWGEYVGLE